MTTLTKILQAKPALHGHALRQWTNRQFRESRNYALNLSDLEKFALKQAQEQYSQRVESNYQNYKQKLAEGLKEGNIVEALKFALEQELDLRCYNNRGVFLEYAAKAAFDREHYALARELIQNAIANYQQETELGGNHCYQGAAERLQIFLKVQSEEIAVFKINSTEDAQTIEGRIHPNLVSIIVEREARYLIYQFDERRFPAGRENTPEMKVHLEKTYALELEPLELNEEASAKFALFRSLWAYIRGGIVLPDDKLGLPWCYATPDNI